MARKSRLQPTPGYSSNGTASLEVHDWTPSGDGLDWDVSLVASYQLGFLPDTSEVVLLKTDPEDGTQEAIYSETIATERGTE